MTKTQSPLLSFEAEGSIGKEITYAHLPIGTIAKATPTHPDAHTLPQVYQRWLYTDAWWAWYALTPTQRNTWHTNARPFRLTGWQYFVKKYLILPTDLVLWMKLDEASGLYLYDSSKHKNKAWLFGTSPATGIIDLCRSFDGIDDYGAFPINSFNYTIFTICYWQKTTYTGRFAFGNYTGGPIPPYASGWLTTTRPNGRPSIQIGGNVNAAPPGPLINDGQWHHITFTVKDTDVNCFTDGVWYWQKTYADPPTYANSIYPCLGKYWLASPSEHWKGLLDDPHHYTRVLSNAQILNISQRRYPS